MRNKLKNIILLAGSVLFCAISLELLTSYFLPSYNPSGRFAYYTNKNGVVLGPKNFKGRLWDNSGEFNHEVEINKYGFRDKKDLSLSTAKDIFVVGDSFGFGYGVEENKRFSNILETMIGLRVYNICIPGDFNDYHKLIEHAIKNGATIKTLVIAVCMENDLQYYYSDKFKRSYVLAHGKTSKIQKIKNFFDEHFTLYHILARTSRSNDVLRDFLVKIGFINIGLEMQNKSIDDIEIIHHSINKLLEISEPYNSIILIIPSRRLWYGINKDNDNKVHNEFVNILKTKRVRVIDMRPIFEDSGNPIQFSYLHNGHWNNEGHQRAAEAIYSYLLQNGMVR